MENLHDVPVRVECEFEVVTIYLKDILHLTIGKEDIVGIQSWGYNKTHKYFIEYTLARGKDIMSEYTSRQIWKDILDGLSKVIE